MVKQKKVLKYTTAVALDNCDDGCFFTFSNILWTKCLVVELKEKNNKTC